VLIGLLPERGWSSRRAADLHGSGQSRVDAQGRRRGLARCAAGHHPVANSTDGRRALAADRLEMEQLYNQRLAAYRQAHFKVDAGRGSVEELVDAIVNG